MDSLGRLKADILAALEIGPLDIETDRLDCAGFSLVQTLFAAQREAAGKGVQLRVSAPAGGALAQALDRFGLIDGSPLRPFVENDRWAGLAPSGDNR